ncbi:MAG: substrate-binding domain-containing protein [Breznakiellaceae bacterium]
MSHYKRVVIKKDILLFLGFLLGGLFISCQEKPLSREGPLLLATTTSLDQIGLVATLVDAYQKETGIRIHSIPLGSGAALERGKRKDVDLLLVHAPEQEEIFLREGYGSFRAPILSSSFIILGPPQDPARIRQEPSFEAAFTALSTVGEISGKELFVSRGDDSGTHLFEKKLWTAIGRRPAPPWYLETGQGMAETIAVADSKGLYTLSDKPSWLLYQAHHPEHQLALLYENPQEGITTYSIVVVRQPQKPRQEQAALQFAHFLTSPAAQRIITHYTVQGIPVFRDSQGVNEE